MRGFAVAFPGSSCFRAAVAATADATIRAMDTATEIEIRISDRATAKAKEIFASHADAGDMLRVYVEGGGCSGFQYGFDLERDLEADDYVVERDGVRLVVDPLSYQYIVGSEIDYQEGPAGLPVRRPESERHRHVRLRALVLALELRRRHRPRAAATGYPSRAGSSSRAASRRPAG